MCGLSNVVVSGLIKVFDIPWNHELIEEAPGPPFVQNIKGVLLVCGAQDLVIV